MTHDRVDRAERFVHQQHARFAGDGARHADALRLSAGELARTAIAIRLRRQVDQRQTARRRAASIVGTRPAQQRRNDGDVLRDRHVREQTDGLNRVADASAQLDRIERRDVPIAYQAPVRRTASRDD